MTGRAAGGGEGNAKARLWWWGAAVAVARRPRLWLAALAQVVALAPARWWRRFPPLPLPDRRWLEFRMETAYGDARARPSARDVVAYLEWSRVTRSRPPSGLTSGRARA